MFLKTKHKLKSTLREIKGREDLKESVDRALKTLLGVPD